MPSTSMPYRTLVRSAPFRWWAASSISGRLPQTMLTLAMLLVGRRLGSYALGARLAAIYTLTSALGALWRGRALDRGDLRAGLRRDCVLVGVGFLFLAGLVQVKAPTPLLYLAVLTFGVFPAGLFAGFRSLLPLVVEDPEHIASAYAVDAVLVEVCFVSGPAAAGLIALLVGPVGVLVVMGGVGFVAALVGGRLPHRAVPSAPVVGADAAPPPWRSPTARAVLVLTAVLGVGLGTLIASFAPLAEALGLRPATGGFLDACVAAGSATGGLVIGARLAGRGDPVRRALILLVVLGAATLPLTVVPNPAAAVVLLFVSGIPLASLMGVGSVLLQRHVDPSRATEGFALYSAATLLGAAAGNGLASVLLAVGSVRHLFVVAGIVPLLAAAGLFVALRATGHRVVEPAT